MKIKAAAVKNLKDFRKTGADAVCVYCAGCLATLLSSKKLYFKKVKIYHIIELLQMAIGEEPMTDKKKKKRAKHFFLGTIKKQFPILASKKTFKIAEIPEDPSPYGEAW